MLGIYLTDSLVTLSVRRATVADGFSPFSKPYHFQSGARDFMPSKPRDVEFQAGDPRGKKVAFELSFVPTGAVDYQVAAFNETCRSLVGRTGSDHAAGRHHLTARLFIL
jgi:hypothetical protein